MELKTNPIGKYITPINEKNKENNYSNVLGVAIEKEFMPSVANLIDTDLSKYSVLRKGRFAFNPMHVGRDMKLPVAMYKNDEPALVSPAYSMFEVTCDEILPKYLELILKSSDFDHLCWFHTDASVRGGLTWDDFSNLEISVPSLQEQEKIVHDYKVVVDRIELLKEIDAKLFEFAKALMIKNYDNENLFYDLISIKSFCNKTFSGATPNRSKSIYWISNDIPWLKNGEVKNNIILDTEEYISNRALKETAVKLTSEYAVNMAMYCVSDIQVSLSILPITSNQAVLNLITDTFRKASYLYYFLATFGNDITNKANGSAQQNLSKEIIDNYQMKNPVLNLNNFDFFETNLRSRIEIAKEIKILSNLKNNILSTLTKEV